MAMAYRYNPGGSCANCGCGCTPDADHICLCNCTGKFPKTFFFGDGLGQHTLTWNPNTGLWQASAFVPNTDTCFNAFLGGPCQSAGIINMGVGYALAPCITILGVKYWRFSMVFPTGACQPDPVILKSNPCYGNPNIFQTQFVNPHADTPFSCDFSMLQFNMPTVVFDDPVHYNFPLDVPGGGGLITLVP
jgi:hypothetical protein